VVELVVFLMHNDFVAKFFCKSVHINLVCKSVILSYKEANWNIRRNRLQIKLGWSKCSIFVFVCQVAVAELDELAFVDQLSKVSELFGRGRSDSNSFLEHGSLMV